MHRTSVSWSLALFTPLCVAAAACGSEPAGDDGSGATGGVAGTMSAGGAGGTSPSGGTSGVGAGATGGTSASGGNAGAGGSGKGGSGGSTMTGGSAGTPPIAGTGGTGQGGSGGAAATAGVGATAGDGAGGGSGGLPPTMCNITVGTNMVSPDMATVGIIEFSTDLAGITSARIEFGLDTNYGMTAPVDLDSPNYRTLLLGMKQRSTYHFRVVASNGSGECAGPDATIETGSLQNGLPELDITTEQPDKRAGGFVITGQYTQAGGSSPAYIFDVDGDIVWAYGSPRDVTGARMSYDGKYMWINSANVPKGQASVVRVSMDGSMVENFSQQFTGQNHQMTILPDETVAFYAYGTRRLENGTTYNCDDIKERAPDGTVKTIVNAGDAHGVNGNCHLNTIQYSPEDDTLVFSDLDHDNITKVRRNGETVWVIGGSSSDFTGNGSSWDTQHGIHILGLDRLVFFNNASDTENSNAIELELNLQSMTATKAWSYNDGQTYNMIMGDVQRLPNGNTLVAYSTRGVLHQVDANSQLVEEWVWPINGAFGYIEWRPDLYGPPEK